MSSDGLCQGEAFIDSDLFADSLFGDELMELYGTTTDASSNLIENSSEDDAAGLEKAAGGTQTQSSTNGLKRQLLAYSTDDSGSAAYLNASGTISDLNVLHEPLEVSSSKRKLDEDGTLMKNGAVTSSFLSQAQLEHVNVTHQETLTTTIGNVFSSNQNGIQNPFLHKNGTDQNSLPHTTVGTTFQTSIMPVVSNAVSANQAPVHSETVCHAKEITGHTTTNNFSIPKIEAGVAVNVTSSNPSTTSHQPPPVQQHQQKKTESTTNEKNEFTELFNKPVNTSTSYVTTLTSPNWMDIFSGGTDPAAPRPIKRRRRNLAPDERARLSRDRNREHARNTRLRKKAYLEELQRTIVALAARRDAVDRDAREKKRVDLEQREVRFRVIEEFLNLRGRGERNFSRWVTILAEEFVLTLPVTRYRNMVRKNYKEEGDDSSGECLALEQTLQGATEAMEDAALLAAFLEQTFGCRSKKVDNANDPQITNKIHIKYNCDANRLIMDSCTAMLDWTATTVGVVNQGFPEELVIKGCIKATFCPASNKLTSAKLSFDTSIIVSKLEQYRSRNSSTREDSTVNADALIDSIEMPFLTGSNKSLTAPPYQKINRLSFATGSISHDIRQLSDEC
eukprot:CAMPEP_0172491452 /NCGR_PEP_ID=MMETSP1066-20121228/22294_1 /TAXON_ID=671091 /ORGANISM="Coscinodiscus wailesii, Strain CCMP2513" /LENGTH=619 /DNA_ID=CAMNT_0013260513 /DNA_START=140 /DNA_END=1999 /DNA_ORIENTATION=-